MKSNGVWSGPWVRAFHGVRFPALFRGRALEPAARVGALVFACPGQLRVEVTVRILVEIQPQRDCHDKCALDQPRLGVFGPADAGVVGHPR